MSVNSPFNINDLTPMNSFSYSTVDKVMLIEFSSLEQTKVSNYFHSHKTGLVMKQNWFGDRTFKVCPQIIFQIYTIHPQINGRILPCIYALLPNKTEETYTTSFREVEQHVANSPTDILMDFERAASNSVCLVYLNTELKGFFNHFASVYGSIFKTLVYRNTIKTMKTLPCGFACFLH